jgi:hypothetical protein
MLSVIVVNFSPVFTNGSANPRAKQEEHIEHTSDKDWKSALMWYGRPGLIC